MAQYIFPEGFLWGASTSSHQVEGGTHNQWSEWEQSPARIEALNKEGLIARHGKEAYLSGIATDHYRRYRDDFALARSLGHTATRISIEWSRIEPEEGQFNKDAIAHYRDVIATIRAQGMEPFVTLWHWTMPLWFTERGAFLHRRNITAFAHFVERIVAELPEVTFWITINEPMVYAGNSYSNGLWPPQQHNAWVGFRIAKHLALAHRAAYAEIKRVAPHAQVGVAKTNIDFEAYHNLPWNRAVKYTVDRLWNFTFLNRIADVQDFIGVNHYFRNLIRGGRLEQNEKVRVSDMGWELYPEAIYRSLMSLRKYRRPIYITENGLADAKDAQREWFIKETLMHVYRAITDGVDVRGYLHWSLMDNFEWADGFIPRFGLIAIDYATQQRTPRPSAYVYKKICDANGL